MEGRRWVVTRFVLAALLAGCAGSGDDKRPDGTGCKPPDEPTISYASNIQPIFDTSCALAGCHLGAGPAFGLDLSAGASYSATVGVAATQRPKLLLVDPGDADDSYLVRKIEGGPDIAGDMMPVDAPPLEPDEITAIRQWILECALDT
jgi:hypothetical protein